MQICTGLNIPLEKELLKHFKFMKYNIISLHIWTETATTLLFPVAVGLDKEETTGPEKYTKHRGGT